MVQCAARIATTCVLAYQLPEHDVHERGEKQKVVGQACRQIRHKHGKAECGLVAKDADLAQNSWSEREQADCSVNVLSKLMPFFQ